MTKTIELPEYYAPDRKKCTLSSKGINQRNFEEVTE